MNGTADGRVNSSKVVGEALGFEKSSLTKTSSKQAELSVKPQGVKPESSAAVADTPDSPVKLICWVSLKETASPGPSESWY